MQKPRCVLVDDDQLFLAVVRQLFLGIRPDFEAIAFFNSLEALAYLKRDGADLVITDFRMPFVDGLRLTAAVRLFDAEVPILMVSGEEIGEEARDHGATAFLRKQELTTALGPILERIGIHEPAC